MRRRRGAVFVVVYAGLLLAGAASARETARSVEGVDRAVLVLPGEASVARYENAGYRLRPLGDAFEVEVDLLPLDSSAPFTAPDGAGRGPVERLARQLVRGSRDRYEAVSRLLGWVARHVRYRLDRSAPQSAEAVLERGDGYCTGIARLTTELLRAVDIEAREVAGFVVDQGDRSLGPAAASAQASGYHRWIEVYYPDRGWVFSDPLHFHHFVPANYVRLSSERLELAPGHSAGAGRSLVRDRRVEIADVYPRAPSPVLARRNRARQLASTLRVLVESGRKAEGALRLTGDGRVWTQRLVEGEGTFVGLVAGSYELRVEMEDGSTAVRTLRMDAPVRSVLSLGLEPGGRGTGATDRPASPGKPASTALPRARGAGGSSNR